MSYYAHNLAILRKRRPDLAKRLQATHERVDPKVLVSSLDRGLSLSAYDVIVAFGFGTYLLDVISRIPKRSFLLIVEPSLPVFNTALSLFDISPFLSDRVDLAVGEDPFYAMRVRLDNYFGILTMARSKILEHAPSIHAFPDYFQKARVYFQESINVAQRNIATLRRFASLWRSQILKNITAIVKHPGISCLKGKFRGLPAIVVSAGPSLDRNVMELRSAKGRALIICVDTALRTLHDAGVRPDIIVSIDAGKENIRDFDGIVLRHETLVAVPVIHPEIISLFTRPIFFTSYGHPLMGWIEGFIGDRGYTKVGGSVTTTAFELVRWIGASPVIFVGLDLGFTEGGDHTKGAFFYEEWLDYIERFKTLETFEYEATLGDVQKDGLLEVPDVWGGKVQTTKQMNSWRLWIESQIREVRMFDKVDFVDATEGGAKIAGTKIMSLKEALKVFCRGSVKVSKILSEAASSYEISNLGGLISGISELINEWLVMASICVEGKKVSEDILTGLSSRRRCEAQSRLGSLCRFVFSRRKISEIFRWSIEPILIESEIYKRTPSSREAVRKSQVLFTSLGELSHQVIMELKGAREELVEMTKDASYKWFNNKKASLSYP